MRSRAIVVVLAILFSCVASEPGRQVIRRIVPPNANGPVQTWWADGRLREDGVYRNGLRHGHVRGFHPDGSLAFEGDFEDGLPAGDIDTHYPGGGLAVSTEAKGGGTATRTEYFPDGGRAVESEFADGVRAGIETRWHENGVKASEGRFASGHPTGRWMSWDAGGRLDSERWYWLQGGTPEGHLETVFAPTGGVNVQTRVLVVDDDWRTRVTFWHPNGRQAGLAETVNGARHGLDQSWDSEGHRLHEGHYEDDQRHGVWIWWKPSGEVVRRVRYEHGHEVTEPVHPG